MSSVHVVQQGESLGSIAVCYQFSSWKTIYDYSENADFRQLRPNPNIIYPGDKLVIPDREKRNEDKSTDQRHSFVKKSTELLLRIVLKNGQGDALGGCAYKLEVAGKTLERTTSGDGKIEEHVPPDASDATLTLWLDSSPQGQSFQWALKIAHLDPVEYLTGVQARLNNLAFEAGPVDGRSGPKTKAAVEAFQEQYKLKTDGIPGPRTQAKLKEVYGC